MILAIDPTFDPLPSSEKLSFESFIFSGGEPHIKITPPQQIPASVTITHRIRSFNDLGLLCLAVDALRRMGMQQLDLILPYFPAARQDRVMIPGEPLSVKVYAQIINNLQLSSVTVFDAHSEVTAAVLNHVHAVNNHRYIERVIASIPGDVTLLSPDGGALKKIYKLSQHLGGIEVIECSKRRDVKTGKLSGFKVYAEDLTGKTCLVVDDICDGGGTFLGLADTLKEKGATDLYLAVSHGIFSKGTSHLSASYTKIFTTNSFRDIQSTEDVTCFNLDNHLLHL